MTGAIRLGRHRRRPRRYDYRWRDITDGLVAMSLAAAFVATVAVVAWIELRGSGG
jgi:hypothetical protein